MAYCIDYEFNPNDEKFERIFVDKWENNKDVSRIDNEVNLLTSKSWKKETAEKLLHKFKIKFHDSLAGKSISNPVQGFMDQVYDAPIKEKNSLTGYYFENFFQSHDVILPKNFKGKNYEYNDDQKN